MNNPPPPTLSAAAAALRARAEAIFAGKGAAAEALTPDATRTLMHELQVHQIELEMQNEELRRAHLELDDSRARYFDLYDLAPVGYCTVGETGLILEANLALATLLGEVRQKLVGSRFAGHIVKEDQDAFYLLRKHRLATPAAVPTRGTQAAEPCAEVRMRRNDGAIFWVEVIATAVLGKDGEACLRVVLTDITARKQAEATLRAAEEQHRLLLENLPIGVVVHALDTSIVFANAAATQMLGLSLEQMQGKRAVDPAWRFVWENGQTLPVLEYPVSRALATGRPERSSLVGIDRPAGGDRVWVLVNAVPCLDAGGQVKQIEVTFVDITARKKHEAEKNEHEAQDRKLKKEEMLGRIAGAIAHHFNNQLHTVMGNLELAMQDQRNHGGAIEYLTEAMRAAHKAAEMSGMMLAYAGQPHARFPEQDLSVMCQRHLAHLQAAIPKKVVLTTELPMPGPTVHVGAIQIQQILACLFTNAWEAVGPGAGTIRLTVKTVPPAEISGVHRMPADWRPTDQDYACLEVADTGVGIAPPDFERIFEPFFTSKHFGRGMGLSVVLGILRSNQGAIAVDSRLGKGSVFRVFLPMSAEAIPGTPAPEAPATRQETGGGTVLVVEDEEPVRNIAKSMIKRLGYVVLEAQNGDEALALFRQHQADIRCVLCDLTMPKMDGWATLTALRAIRPDLPVILASGYEEAQVMAGDHPERPQAFLGKPYEMKALREMLLKAINHPA